jgi:TonB-dependent receptor
MPTTTYGCELLGAAQGSRPSGKVALANQEVEMLGNTLLGRNSFILLVVAALSAGMAMAQGGKGALRGRVADASGGTLVGAEVSLEPKGASVVSDAQGQFFVNDLEPGNYRVSVSYIGFTPFKGDVTVAGGQTANLDVKLNVESVNLEVLVTADRAAGEAEEINRERSADNIVQVLTSDVIRSLPNANMADALGRLPSVSIERDEGEGKYVQVRGTEPRLTNTTIDGVSVPSPESGVRQIKFDAIPADIVESVEINKTLQANMDGDGIGGSVNLVTKTAGERPTVSLAGMGGYMPIEGGRPQYETAGTLGQRFGKDKRWGVLFGGTYDWSGRGIDDIEPVSDLATLSTGSTSLIKDSIDVREYRYYRTRWGFAGSTDYKLGEGSNIYARVLYSDFQNYGDRWVYSLTDNTPFFNPLNPGQFPSAPKIFGNTVFGNSSDATGCSVDQNQTLDDGVTPNPNFGNESCGAGTPSFNNSNRRPDIAIGSLLIGGKHVQTSTWFAWDASVSRSRDIDQAGGQANFNSTLGSSNCQFDPAATTNKFRPQWTPACFSETADPSTLTLDHTSVGHGLSAQLNLQFTGAGAKRYHIGSRLASIEVGGKFRNAHKFDNTYGERFDVNSGVTIPLNSFPNGFTNSNYYGGSYQLGYNPNYQVVRDFVNSNLGQFTRTTSQGADPANYSLKERVSAGYLMNTIDFSSKVRVVAGVRFEGTQLDTVSFDNQTNTLSDKASGSYVKILPSVSLRYALRPNTNLRLVYGRGLSRPDPQDIAQSVTFTTTGSPGSQKNTATLGNPNLKAETADNFDVLVEHYLNPFGMISAGYFYKRLTDPIVTKSFLLQNFQPSPIAPPGTYTVTQPINAGDAWISGFEAAYLQHLTFLPGKLGGLGISANYGYTASQANGLDGRSDHPRLLRNAPNTWNVSPTYDRGRVSLRVGLSYNQANIAFYSFQDDTVGGVKGPFGDGYFYSHLQVDAQGSVRLTHGLTFVAYGLNLTNELFGFYQGSPQFMIQREYYTPTIAAGFRWSPVREK